MRYWLLAALLALALPLQAGQAPRVVVTIAPIHSLVAGLMDGAGTPELLLKGGTSPHHYALRPSDARALNKAQLIVWVGEEVESFMRRPLASLGGDARVLELMELPGLQRLPVRGGESWEAHGHENEHAHDRHDSGEEGHEQHHHTGEWDGHIWLDPRNALVIIEAVAGELAHLDPDNAALYRDNAGRLSERLRALDRALVAQLLPVRAKPYMVFHDAYHYFEHRYELNAVGSVTIDPERKPGAKRIRRIRRQLEQLGVRCVFSEPQFPSPLVRVILEGTAVKHGVLDPLGAELAPGKEHYFKLLSALADSLEACLGG